ncbi:hypothetical protein DPX16_0417 [Anabarilius grahami]|uniref:Uncharacterized protein n=1 Tax=Anabarilius grahami TaxID=495550 RepID=A0A3N0XCY6_ANAGA|nr:hypothetical protein DPX16_0417 [Anabarilius grahami]
MIMSYCSPRPSFPVGVDTRQVGRCLDKHCAYPLGKVWQREYLKKHQYDQQSQSVGKCTSDVYEEQKDTKEKLKEHFDKMKALEDALVKLELELRKNNGPQNQEWDIKIRQIDLQRTLANCKIQQGEIPDPDHLTEVRQCLDQIRQILVDLEKFWKKVYVMLETLKENTFVGENLIYDLEYMKEFLESIEEAKQVS